MAVDVAPFPALYQEQMWLSGTERWEFPSLTAAT